MTTTEIIGLISFALSLLGGAYAFIRRVDIREENEKEHKELDTRLNEGANRFREIERKLAELQVDVNNVSNQMNEVERNNHQVISRLDSFADKIEKLLISNAKITQKLEIE